MFPLVYECRDPAVEPGVGLWLGRRAAPRSCAEEACRHGAVLFRGFPLRTAEDFDRFVTAFGWPPFTYEDSLSYAVR